MGNVIIILILVILVVIAAVNSMKHFKGEGGCCGGGGSVRESKKLDAPKIGEKTMKIEGMHCESCRNRVERAVNKIDGAVCKVNLKKKTAKISYSSEIDEEMLKETITKLGYEVVSIASPK
ncbi:MAG: heavy-metal-associated domain-containing protein [Lachnospiraceae bacterium]|nr:heavy-metal-associated domain-containing protein [Lachnospiraceae bacterium]